MNGLCRVFDVNLSSYLACVLDLASKEIVGYALSQTPDAKLANEALLDAVNDNSSIRVN